MLSSSIQAMLFQERQEQCQWLSYSIYPSQSQNSFWRPYLAQWYFSVVASIEEFDGNQGTFGRTIAYTAMKIMDLYLSSYCPTGFQETAKVDQRCYKSLAIACLFVAMNRRCATRDDDDAIILAGKIMPLHIFLRMCNAKQDIPLNEFVSNISSVRAFLRMYDSCFHPPGTPLLVSTHFLDDFKRYLLKNCYAIQKDDRFFHRAEVLMDLTISNAHFADYPPSLNAIASFLVAMQDYCFDDNANIYDEDIADEVFVELITYYQQNGGYGLSYLEGIVTELRSLIVEGELEGIGQRSQDGKLHIIPDYDD